MKTVLSKIAGLVITLWAIASITFILMRMAPGGPYSSDRSFSDDIESELVSRYSVKTSFIRQYLFYCRNIITLDFGPSLRYKDMEVSEIIRESLPVSAILGGAAFLIALIPGLFIGYLGAVKRKQIAGKVIHFLSLSGISMPVFAIAIIFIGFFSFKLKLFPVAGWGSVHHLILPSLVLAMPYMANISNLFRTSYIRAYNREWVIAAEARQTGPFTIFFKYVLREALAPVISYSAPALAGLMTGSIVVENIFAIPGIGTHFINSALNRDYTLLFGVILTYAAILVTFNFISDGALQALDPRIRRFKNAVKYEN